MNAHSKRISFFVRALLTSTALACTFAAAAAQPTAGTGTVEGRVYNPVSGEFLENARITVNGTTLETFTDSDGRYRLPRVPAGMATVKAFFTGFLEQVDEVSVLPGQTIQRDINLQPFQKPEAAGDTVKLSAVVVNTSREMDAAAIAINEQRFAANMVNVVSTEEFGNIAEGNVAEFLKYLPGISVEALAGNAREISIDGVPSDYVPVTLGGFNLASAGGDNNTRRTVDADMVSINNLSRIEVSYSPTPESPGGALAGSVNMVPRSSFERARPVVNFSAYISMRDNARDFDKTPGPFTSPSRKVTPGFDFSYIAPVNKRFGFTLSAGLSSNWAGEPFIQNIRHGVSVATNGAAFPHTTPDQPYLTSFVLRQGGKETRRKSFGATVDYKVTQNDRLSFSFQSSSYYIFSTNHTLRMNVNRVLPGNFTPTSTRGDINAGDLALSGFGRERLNRTFMPTLTWRHDGPVWKATAGLGVSFARNDHRDADKGRFNSYSARRTGVTVSFLDQFYLRPRIITVTDGVTGAPVDPFDLTTFVITGANTNQNTNTDRQRSAYANLRRDFYGTTPFTLKGGLDVRQATRDIRPHGLGYAVTYVGPDGRASTAPAGSDDFAAPLLDPKAVPRDAAYGFPNIHGIDINRLWEHYVANPNYFTINPNNQYRALISNSKHADEIISSAYIRGDLSLLNRRLKLVGGVRAEQTNIHAEGPLTDPTRNFQLDAQGEPIPGANGRPLPITTDALETSRLTFIDRGAKAEKEYLRWFPSLNASFSLRENLIVRAAHYYSVGRPNFNQYAGGITLPDTELPPNPSNNRIVVSNVGIKAWSSKTSNIRLEYYFQGVGQITVSAFRRDYENFFGSTTFAATPEFLDDYNLDPEVYGEYPVATQYNLATKVRTTGVNFSYKQALTFLPHWARGVQVFANGSGQRATGDGAANFQGYVPRTGSWGISLARPKYNVRVNWNYRGRQRRTQVAASTSIGEGTYNWGSKRMNIDVLGEYYFWKRFALFANLRNLHDAAEDFEIAGPSTPDHAQFDRRIEYGSLWTFGLKGTF